MKKLIIKLNIIFFALTYLISARAIDLQLLNAAISSDPIVANSTYTITADIFNNNAASVVNPVDAQFVIFTISNFDLANVPGIGSVTGINGWNCMYDGTIPGMEVINCDQIFSPGFFSAGMTQPFGIQITTGSTVVNPTSFFLETTEESGLVGSVEEFISDNSTTVITVSGGVGPDYEMVVSTSNPSPITINTGTTGPIPFSFEYKNNGTAGSVPESIDIIVANGFALSSVIMTNIVGIGGAVWSCNAVNGTPPTDNDWNCINTNTNNGMAANDKAVINGNITTYPTTVGTTFSAIQAISFVLGDINPSNDSAAIDFVVNAVSVGNLIIDNSATNPNPPTPISEVFHHAVPLPKQIHYRVNNVGGIINKPIGNPSPTVELSIAFNPGFNVSMPNPPAGVGNWSCSPTTTSPISCVLTDNTFAANANTDFTFDVSPLTSTLAGTYNAPGFNVTLTGFGIATPVNFATSLIVINPDISINKTLTLVNGSAPTGAPVNVLNGDAVTYKILAVNNTPNSSAINNIIFTDTLPAGLINPVIVGGLGSFNGNCSFTGVVLTCTSASLPNTVAEDGAIISAVVSGTVGNNIQNQVKLTSVQFDSSVNPLVNANKALLINAAPAGNIAITKVANQSSYTIGDDVIYTITVENISPTFSVSDLEISDLLPGNYLDLNPANVSVVANTLIGTSVFTCTFGALIDTVSCDNIASTDAFDPTDKVEIVITATSSAVGTAIANTADYTSISFNLSGSSTPALIDITQVAPSVGSTSITVEKNVLQNGVVVSEIARGSSFQYEVIVNNTGGSSVNNLSLIDLMPFGVTVDNITTPVGMSCNNQGQIYNCNYSQNIPINSSIQVIYDVTDASDNNILSLINTVRVVSLNAPEKTAEALVNLTGSNPNPPPNPNPNAQYTLEIKDDVDPVQQGDNYNYIVTVTNTGSVVVNALDINVLIPQDLLVNSTNTNGTICSIISSGVHCIASGGLSINPGQRLDIVIINVVSTSFIGDVLVEAQANTTSTSVISDDETTTILENIAIEKADLSVAVLNTQAVTQGGQTSFDVSIDNLGFSALNPRLRVELSGLIDVIQVSENEFWTCDVAGLNVNCQYKGVSMPFEQNSLIHFNLDLSRISTQAENIVIVATAESDTEDDFIGNNTTMATISVNPTPTEGEILSALSSALDGKGNQQINRAIQNVASYCEVSYFKALEGLCSDLYQTALDGDGETINTVMEQITPNEVIGQSTSIAEIATAQFRNIGSRLSQLRTGGGSGFSSAGLNATYGNGSIPIGMLAYLNKSADESSNIDVKNDFISPWGFFVNGTVSMGSRDATGRELGFDFDSYGLTAGVDYRLSASKVVGVALGYANFDSDIDGQASLKSTGLTLTGYGSFYVNDNFYVDARISVAKPDFDQSRDIDFTLGDTTISRVANGTTSSNQYSVAMSAGYNFYKNSWNITPNGSFRYIKTSINGFTETGAGGFNFSYSDQDLESMIWSAGIKVSKAISLKNGVITPQFDYDYNYESLNDGNDIEARFVTAPLGEVFIIETDSPDRTYGSAGLGFAYISSNGKQAYINYRSVLGLEGFSRGTFNLGARFEF